MKKHKGTETSKFGVSARVNHNSEKFYKSRLYEDLPTEKKVKYVENIIPQKYLDTIICKSCENMQELPDNSVHLVVTSPPYNVGKEYDQDLSLSEYLSFLRQVWLEVYRVLVPGGRVCINIANLGRKPYIPLHSFIIRDMLEIGFLMRGEVIWNKGASANSSTAWGSWLSAKNPTLRDVHEYILIFSKDTFKRETPEKRESTITKEEFLEYTRSVWNFSPVSARKIGHPAPFPEELPYRCIQLYTFKGEIVLDPFMGSGQTAISAIKTGRHFVGYEIDKQYIELANKRIKEFKIKFNAPKLF